jgi:hypothetical protein
MVMIDYAKFKMKTCYRRNWQNYSEGGLNSMLSEENWNMQDDTVKGS